MTARIISPQQALPQSLVFSVPGQPRGKGRPRVSARGRFPHLYTDAKTVAYETTVKDAAFAALRGRPPIEGPIAVLIEVRLSPPASASKKAKVAMLSGATPIMGRFDLDNIVKAILDGCNKIAFVDDRQVIDLTAYVIADEAPSVSVAIAPAQSRVF